MPGEGRALAQVHSVTWKRYRTGASGTTGDDCSGVHDVERRSAPGSILAFPA